MLAAVGAIVALVYLAFQIRLFSNQQRANALESVLKEHQHTGEMLTRSDLAPIISRGVNSFDSLTPIEQLQFNGFWVKYLYSFLNIRDHYQAGNIEYSRFEGFERDLVCCMLAPGMKQWWSVVGETHLEIKDYINQLIADGEGKLVPYSEYMPGWRRETSHHPPNVGS